MVFLGTLGLQEIKEKSEPQALSLQVRMVKKENKGNREMWANQVLLGNREGPVGFWQKAELWLVHLVKRDIPEEEGKKVLKVWKVATTEKFAPKSIEI